MAKMEKPNMNNQNNNQQINNSTKSLQDLIIHDDVKQTRNQQKRIQNNKKQLSKRALFKKKKSKPSYQIHDAFDELEKQRNDINNKLNNLSNSSDSLFQRIQEDNMQKDLQEYDKEKNLESLINNQEIQNKQKNKKKKKKHKKKHKSVLTNSQKKKASFIGKLILPLLIFFALSGALTVCLMNVLMLHQVEVISTLASPKYYAELGARHLLGGARKITDIPQDLIGSEPDLNTDYQHNDAMNKDSALNKATKDSNVNIGNISDSGDALKLFAKIAKAVAKIDGIKHPNFVFDQLCHESGGTLKGVPAANHNASGIKFANQPGASPGSISTEGDHYAKFDSWTSYTKAYAKTLKNWPQALKANTISEYARGLKNGLNGGAYYGNSHTDGIENYIAGMTRFDSQWHQYSGYGGGPSSATISGYGAGGGKRQKVIDLAETRVKAKIPYVYGGTNWNSGMDCSGLVMNCMQKAGYSDFPRTSGAQYQYLMKKGCKREAINQAKPGDLGFEGTDGSEHVCIYKGDNTVIEEPEPGTPCHERQVYSGLYFVDCSKFYGSGGGDVSSSSKHGKKDKSGSDSDNSDDSSGGSSNGAYESGNSTDYLNYAGYRTRRMLYYYNGRNATEQLHSALSDGTASGHKSSSKSSSSGSKNDGKFPYNPDADELKIINAESSGNPHAVNGQYYGIFQTTAANYERYCAGLKNADWKNNKGVQLYCMRRYEKERYGGYANNDFSKPDKATTARAVADRMAKGWW